LPQDHVTNALVGLHWLPVAARIEFKLCLLVYEALNSLAPSYITDMRQPVSTLDRHVTLRSVDNNDLFIFYSCLHLRERAFHIAAPRAWNSLPSDMKNADTVKTFKKTIRLSCSANIMAIFNYFYGVSIHTAGCMHSMGESMHTAGFGMIFYSLI